MGAFLKCVRCGGKIHAAAPKIVTADGYRCTTCEYEIRMGANPNQIPIDRP